MPATQDYWPFVLNTLKESITGSNYRAWFSNLEFVTTGNHGRKITLRVPSSFNKNYIENKFKTQLQEAISKYYPQVIHIDYQIVEKSEPENTVIQESLLPAEPSLPRLLEDEQKPDKDNFKISSFLPNKSLNNLNPKYTFDNFVVTKNNELAVSIGQSIIGQPGTLYNPVFLYSGVGLGKTHLLQAIGQKMLTKRPDFNIKYITSETFVNHFVSSIQKNKGGEFRDYYRSKCFGGLV